ncbi:MAG: DNA internalization-related competence protein ComEC/Rec2 [Chloroflexi bacterium]|nr:DNA internalization-related competence protein ComEC/Rec2 [Chloroflexota bacterium]
MTLVYLVVAWLAGIVCWSWLDLPWPILPVLGLAALTGRVAGRNNVSLRIGSACVFAFVLGAGRLLLDSPHVDQGRIALYNDTGWVTVDGVVIEDPDERDTTTHLVLRVERMTLADGVWQDASGRVLVIASRYPAFEYGDRLRVHGQPRTPPVLDDFSYRDYLARRHIYTLIRRPRITRLAGNQASSLLHLLYRFRHHARAVVAGILPEPQAALLSGILLGIESGIPADLMDAFSATGATHIIAISGFNLTLLSGVISGVARRLVGRRRSFWLAVAVLGIYTVFVGGSSAVVRAAWMGVMVLLARHIGRPAYAPTAIAAAALVMTATNPNCLWDVGFQLSFAATAGLLLYARPLERWAARWLERVLSEEVAQRMVDLVSDGVLVTLAALVTTMPVILYHFGQLSLVTLLTNVLILPVQPAVLMWGGCATLLALVVRPLGQAMAWIAWVFLTYTIEAVRLTARVPYAAVPVRIGPTPLVIYYAGLLAVTWWWSRSAERRKEIIAVWRPRLAARVSAGVTVGAGLVLLVLGLGAWRTLPDGRLHVVFLDVGQGDAIFIQTPSGRQVLIDGGPGEAALLSQLGRRMPFWDRTLDLVLLTHSDADHVTGLVPVLQRFDISVLIFQQEEVRSAVYAAWLEAATVEGAVIHTGEAGLHVALDEGVELTVLHPSSTEASPNDSSVVTRLTYGDVSVLLTGDIGATVERSLVAQGVTLDSTVLKVAHHGSCTSTTPEFLDAVTPDVAVISVGADNDLGLPCEDVLMRLGPVYRTDVHGSVELITDGSRVWVQTEQEMGPVE